MYLLGNEYQEKLLDILDNVSVRSINITFNDLGIFNPY
jgi:hypothetical protein